MLVLAAGCTPRPLVERAIRARGGPLDVLVRQGEATVRRGFPGRWQWRTVYLLPDHYALTVRGAQESFHYLLDGTVVRAFAGDRLVSRDAGSAAPLITHAHFTAVVNLDALRLPGYRVAPLPAAELEGGVREGVAVVIPDTGARYRLGFDEHDLLVWATGPLDLAPLGRGEVTARYGDFRRVGGLLLPFKTSYALAGVPVIDEQALAVCPNLLGITAAAFQSPGRLPACGVEP